MSSETDGTDQRQICRCNECEKRKETVPQEFQGFKKAGFRDCLFLYFKDKSRCFLLFQPVHRTVFLFVFNNPGLLRKSAAC